MAFRSLLAFWMGGAKGNQFVALPSWAMRSMLAHWMGGAKGNSPPTGAVPHHMWGALGGSRNVHGMWGGPGK